MYTLKNQDTAGLQLRIMHTMTATPHNFNSSSQQGKIFDNPCSFIILTVHKDLNAHARVQMQLETT